MNTAAKFATICAALAVFAASPGIAQRGNATPAQQNVLTAAQTAAGWRLLFDGKAMTSFRGYKMDSVPAAWHVVDGTITKSVGTEDIVTREQFADFELEIEWKIGTGGNSGIFYRGTEEYDHIYWSAPEYQLLDDANAPDGKSRLTSAGSDYGLYPSPAGILKPANEWNTTRILVRGNHVEHWLNGQKLLEYEFGSADWQAKVAASKFRVWPNYGKAAKGYIAIQGDHNGVLTLRNIRIRVL